MNKSQDQKFMRMAIREARKGVRSGQTPFGAVIVKNNKVISCAHNGVWKRKDITAHAEVVAIRKACKKLKTIDLSGCVLYSTCEPCPMCFSASHWARIPRIVYGVKIKDASRIGFNELPISCSKLKRLSKSSVKLVSGFLSNESIKVFEEWAKKQTRRAY